MMKRVIQLTGLILTAYLFTGCVSDSIESSPNSTLPIPTIHPRLDTSDKILDEATPIADGATVIDVVDNIHTISILPSDGSIIIAWVSENPGLGNVTYGRTEQYELGNIDEELSLSQHAITLDNLEAETTYYYRIAMVDTETNTISTHTDTFKTIREIPIIDVWYGSEQSFGQNGTPQRWINILGNVSDPDGIHSLTYSLNGGQELPLSIGSDLHRLVETGDFNVDIFRTALTSGENELVLHAVDTLDHQETVTVTINYTDDTVWSDQYEIDWSIIPTVEDAVEIVDGLWEINNGAVRTITPGYNRLLSIGDIAWTDYEVVVPITAHDMHFTGGDDGTPGLGLLLRWTGHTDISYPDWQPRTGGLPFGAIAWYHWDTPDTGFLRLEGTIDNSINIPSALPLLDIVYMYKVRVETLNNSESLYRFKMWRKGQPEPATWDLSNEIQGLPNGSLLLLAHQVDASFGNVTVTQLAPPALSPFLPSLSVLEDFSATISLTDTLPLTITIPITTSGSLSCTICTVSLPTDADTGSILQDRFNHFMLILPQKMTILAKPSVF